MTNSRGYSSKRNTPKAGSKSYNSGGLGYRTLLDARLLFGRENHGVNETLICFWEIQGFLEEETDLCIA